MHEKFSMTVKKISRFSRDRAFIYHINRESFTGFDHISYKTLMKYADAKGCDLLIFYDGKEPCAYAVMLVSDAYAYILYCAVAPDHQGRGLGTEMISTLIERYEGKNMVIDLDTPKLTREELLQPEPETGDHIPRLFRFYENFGFSLTGCCYVFKKNSLRNPVLAQDPEGFTPEGFMELFSIMPDFMGSEVIKRS